MSLFLSARVSQKTTRPNFTKFSIHVVAQVVSLACCAASVVVDVLMTPFVHFTVLISGGHIATECSGRSASSRSLKGARAE